MNRRREPGVPPRSARAPRLRTPADDPTGNSRCRETQGRSGRFRHPATGCIKMQRTLCCASPTGKCCTNDKARHALEWQRELRFERPKFVRRQRLWRRSRMRPGAAGRSWPRGEPVHHAVAEVLRRRCPVCCTRDATRGADRCRPIDSRTGVDASACPCLSFRERLVRRIPTTATAIGSVRMRRGVTACEVVLWRLSRLQEFVQESQFCL